MSHPFVEPVRRNETAAPLDRVTEGWFFRRGFRLRIDGSQAKRLVFGPVRNQTPSHEGEDARWFGRVLADGCDLLSGSNVPVRLPGRILIETEVIPHVAIFRGQSIAPAHGKSV